MSIILKVCKVSVDQRLIVNELDMQTTCDYIHHVFIYVSETP